MSACFRLAKQVVYCHTRSLNDGQPALGHKVIVVGAHVITCTSIQQLPCADVPHACMQPPCYSEECVDHYRPNPASFDTL
jgi:hypothetical protein